MGNIRLSKIERSALQEALLGFQGEVLVFGSRLDLNKRGGDIDILLKPTKKTDRYDLKTSITLRFMRQLEQSLDVVVFDDQSPFCLEIIKHAKPFDFTSLQ